MADSRVRAAGPLARIGNRLTPYSICGTAKLLQVVGFMRDSYLARYLQYLHSLGRLDICVLAEE